MSAPAVHAGGVALGGGGPLFLIAGPCAIEDRDTCLRVAEAAAAACRSRGMPYVFKASFDKANRTRGDAPRGVGLDAGLAVLSAVKDAVGVPVLTDVHESGQAGPAAEVADVLQIPAFLCRQTDLIAAAAATGRALNIKKGPFMSPEGMARPLEKARAAGAGGVMITERGVCFGYDRLVSDLSALSVLRGLGCPVVFDATHSVQRPAGAGPETGGDRALVAPLARAAVAAGVDGLFIETHPDPDRAGSDAASQMPLEELPGLLDAVVAIDAVVRGLG